MLEPRRERDELGAAGVATIEQEQIDRRAGARRRDLKQWCEHEDRRTIAIEEAGLPGASPLPRTAIVAR